jgi:hypothetical protein
VWIDRNLTRGHLLQHDPFHGNQRTCSFPDKAPARGARGRPNRYSLCLPSKFQTAQERTESVPQRFGPFAWLRVKISDVSTWKTNRTTWLHYQELRVCILPKIDQNCTHACAPQEEFPCPGFPPFELGHVVDFFLPFVGRPRIRESVVSVTVMFHSL